MTAVDETVDRLLADLMPQIEDVKKARTAANGHRHNPGGFFDNRRCVVESVFVDSAMEALVRLQTAMREQRCAGVHAPQWREDDGWICGACGIALDVRKRSG